MRVLFLDCDGVINSTKWFSSDKSELLVKDEDVDPNVVERLNKFVQQYDLKIVISSDWRIDNYYKKRLENAGIYNIIDKTPITIFDGYLDTYQISRGKEIQMWLDKHSEVDNFIIFDDMEITEHDGHFVKINPMYGLRLEDLIKAKKFLS